jgi:demethoxyubiquinone hydroxylase (CLK1/Coq7/Cat5 family)
MDKLIAELDRALRAMAGVANAARPSPAEEKPESELDPSARAHAAALMRVNHVGEICAQALYQGQALTARNARIKAALEQAAREEEDHLAWSIERIRELDDRLDLRDLICTFNYFTIDHRRCLASMRRFIERVMPELPRRAAEPAAAMPVAASPGGER